MKDLRPKTYLDKNFDYNRLTKTELRKILLENNIYVRASSLKQELLQVYKQNIYDKIEILKHDLDKSKNVFQNSRSSIIDINLNDINESKPVVESVFKRTSLTPVSNKDRNLSLIGNQSLEQSETDSNTHRSFIKTSRHTLSPDKVESFSNSRVDPEVRLINKSSISYKPLVDMQTEKQNMSNHSFNKLMTPVNQNSISQANVINEPLSLNESISIQTNFSPKKEAFFDKSSASVNSFVYKSDKRMTPNTSIVSDIPNILLTQESIEKPNTSLCQQSSIEDASFNFEIDSASQSSVKKEVLAKEKLKKLIDNDQNGNLSRDNTQYNTSEIMNEPFINSSFVSYSDTHSSNVKRTVDNRIIRRKSKFWSILRIFLLFSICVSYCILKNLPYCDGKNTICVPLPSNSYFVDDKIFCKKEFLYTKSIFRNYCRKDDNAQRVAKNIVRRLEFQHGDYLYGRVKSYKVPVFRLSTDPEVIRLLSNFSSLKLDGNDVYSTKYSVSFRTFLHFYCKKMFFICTPFLITLGLLKYWIVKRRKRRDLLNKAKSVTKDILALLFRQLVFATNNNRFPEYVYIDQLRDVYGEDTKVWNKVVQKVSSNSNVSTYKVDERDVWHWIGPFIHSTEDINPISRS